MDCPVRLIIVSFPPNIPLTQIFNISIYIGKKDGKNLKYVKTITIEPNHWLKMIKKNKKI